MAGYLYNPMGVADITGIYNYQPDYTGTGSPIISRNYGRHNGAAAAAGRNIRAMQNTAINNHPVNGSPFGVTQVTIGAHNDVDIFSGAAHSCAAMVSFEELTQGLLNEVGDNAGRILSQTSGDSNFVNYEGMRNLVSISSSARYDNAAGTVIVNAYGAKTDVSNRFTATAGNVTVNSYGEYITVLGSTSGVSTAYGLYIASVSGADINWALWNNAGNVFLGNDNAKTYWGTAQDASMYYDATDLVINPKEVGSGVLSVLGDIRATGTGAEGLILYDTTLAGYYRITLDNGVVVITAI